MKKIILPVLILLFICSLAYATTMTAGQFSRFHYGSGSGVIVPPDPEEPGVGTIAIATPVPYQVFQRTGTSGNIIITGTYTGNPNRIEASFNGGSWTTIVNSPTGNSYTGSFSATQGQGVLSVRFGNNASIVATKNLIGVGEVFLVAGQSNSSSLGTNLQTYSSTDGLKAGLFGNNYQWKELSDPYDSPTGQVDLVSRDFSARGSWVLLLATQIMNDQHVPVAFIPANLSGSGIIQWQPGADHQNRSTLYGSAVYRALQATKVRAVLWWQGEHEANVGAGTNLSTAEYQGYYNSLVNSFWADLQAPTMACLLQNSSGLPDVNEGYVRTAVTNVVSSNVHAYEGPDLSDIGSDDLYHLLTNAKLQTAADRWFIAIRTAFYSS